MLVSSHSEEHKKWLCGVSNEILVRIIRLWAVKLVQFLLLNLVHSVHKLSSWEYCGISGQLLSSLTVRQSWKLSTCTILHVYVLLLMPLLLLLLLLLPLLKQAAADCSCTLGEAPQAMRHFLLSSSTQTQIIYISI